MADAFAPLLMPGLFQIVESEASKSFDNAYVELRGGGFRLRVIQERGHTFADFRPIPGNDWFDSSLVRELVDGTRSTSAEIQLPDFVDWIQSRLVEIVRRFDTEREESTKRLLGIREDVDKKRWSP